MPWSKEEHRWRLLPSLAVRHLRCSRRDSRLTAPCGTRDSPPAADHGLLWRLLGSRPFPRALYCQLPFTVDPHKDGGTLILKTTAGHHINRSSGCSCSSQEETGRATL